MMTLIGQDFAQKMANDCYYVVSTTSITMDGPGAHWIKNIKFVQKYLWCIKVSSTKQNKLTYTDKAEALLLFMYRLSNKVGLSGSFKYEKYPSESIGL